MSRLFATKHNKHSTKAQAYKRISLEYVHVTCSNTTNIYNFISTHSTDTSIHGTMVCKLGQKILHFFPFPYLRLKNTTQSQTILTNFTCSLGMVIANTFPPLFLLVAVRKITKTTHNLSLLAKVVQTHLMGIPNFSNLPPFLDLINHDSHTPFLSHTFTSILSQNF